MSDFKLSNGLNKNKVFLVRRSKIEGRLDSLYYYENLDFTNTIKLGSIAKISGGKRLPKDVSYELTKTPYRYLRIGDIDSLNQLHYEDFEYLSERTFNILGRYEIINGDIALAIVGATIGKCVEIDAPYEDRIILTENCAKIHIENKNVYSKFLLLVLQSKFVQKQIELNYIQTTLPKLGLDRVYNLRIPELPILDVQKSIVLKYNLMHLKSREKQSQSKALLKSIDLYLLNELGIELPKNDNSLKARIFTTKFKAVCGNRLDPFYVKNESNKMKSKSFEEIALGDMAVIEKGQTITSDEIIEGCFPVIAGGQTSPYNHNVYNYKENCITISASGAYAGYVWYHETPIFASDCLVVYSNDEEKMSTLFLSEILKLKQSEIYDMQQGAGQPHVYAKDIYSIQIPLPPLSKQIEIADHIKQIRQQAKQLEIEAEQILTDAKKEIEKMILGEEKWY